MTITWYGGSTTSYAEINGSAVVGVTSGVYRDEALTDRILDLRDADGNVTDHVTAGQNGHYKYGVVDWSGVVYVNFGNGTFAEQPRDMGARLVAVEALGSQVTSLQSRVTTLESSDFISSTAIGQTVAPLDPTTFKVPAPNLPDQATFSPIDLGNVSGAQVVDVSKYNDISFTMTGDFSLSFAAIANPAYKGEWTARPAQDGAGGHVLSLPTVNRWEGAGTGVTKATALAVSTVANSESELAFISRDGGLVAQTALYCKPGVRPVTSLDSVIRSLTPTRYYPMTETTGTAFADAMGGASASSVGAVLGQPASTPSNSTGKAVATTKTGYVTLPAAVGNLTTGFTILFPTHGDDIGADWVSTGSVAGGGAYCEGRTGDTGHNQAALMLAAGKYRSWKPRVLIRVIKGGVPVDVIGGTGQDDADGMLWDGRDRFTGLRGTPVDSTHFKVELIIDGTILPSNVWTFDPTGCTFNPQIASLGAFVRGDVQSGQWARYEAVAQWTRPITDAELATYTNAWKGSRVNNKRTWPSGVFVNNGSATALANFGAMRGKPCDRVIIFNSATTWADIESIANIHSSYRTPEFQNANSSKIYYSVVGLPFGDSSQTLTQGAAGTYDFHFTNLANNLKAAGFTQPCIRVLEEPDLTSGYWPHGIANASNAARNFAGGLSQGQVFANYRTYFQNIVRAMRAVLPLATFDFSTQVIAYGWERYYPGDGWVDRITPDLYDIDWEQNTLPAVEDALTRLRKLWSGNGNNGMLMLSRFILPGASRLDDSPGAGVLTTSTKRLLTGLTEWGLANKEWGSATSGKGGGGGDDPAFVDWVEEWFASRGVGDVSGVGQELYFNYATGAAGTYGPRHSIDVQGVDDKPLSRARYQFWNAA